MSTTAKLFHLSPIHAMSNMNPSYEVLVLDIHV